MNLAEQQLQTLRKIWGRTSRGYVFLPHIPAAQARDPKQRKKSWKEGRGFRWPEEQAEIIEHLAKHEDDDLYFCPMVFRGPLRKKGTEVTGNRLWADLDEVDPESIEEQLKPTFAWETSPGRYAAVWMMTSARPEVTEPGMENHRLTMYLGADPSGWDTTQLLRVPLSANNKPEYKRGIRGEWVWRDRGVHDWDYVDDLPNVEVHEVTDDLVDQQLIDGIDRHDVWGRVRLRVSSPVRQFMRMKDSAGEDRSSVAWQIERDLADAGCTLAEIVAVIRPTPWNKYEGRQDELRRLLTECSKAIAAVKAPDHTSPLEAVDDQPKPTLQPFWERDDYLNAPDPEWLVDDFIPRGGCGFIAGIPKSMKSWIALDLAICMTTGYPFLGYPINEVCNVLYIQQEDPATLVRDRHSIIAGSKDPSYRLDSTETDVKPYPAKLFMEIYSGFTGDDEGWQSWLADVIADNDVSLVIMDTLATIAGSTDYDKAKEVKMNMLDPIKRIARDTNCAMLLVHHMNKASGSSRAGQNMAGSGQIHAWADYGIYCIEKDNDNKLTFDHETKYTGTTRLHFAFEGLDHTPQAWEPREIVKGATGTGEVTEEMIMNAPTGKGQVPLWSDGSTALASYRTKHHAIFDLMHLGDPQKISEALAEQFDMKVAPGTVKRHMDFIREHLDAGDTLL